VGDRDFDLAGDGDRDPFEETGEGVLEMNRTGDLVEDLERDLDLAGDFDTDRDLDLAGDLDTDRDLDLAGDFDTDLDEDLDLDLDREFRDTDLDFGFEFSDGVASFLFLAFGGPEVSVPFDSDTEESFLEFSHSLSFSSSRFLITW